MRASVHVAVFALGLVLARPVWAEAEHEGHGHHDEPEVSVELSAEEQAEFDITMATAGPGEICQYIELPGEVRPNGDKTAHIVPRYAGIVKEVRKELGQRVAEGDVLAVVESSQTLVPYKLQTLIPGTIVEKHITRGEAVTRESELFVITDLSTVWVDLSVYQRDLSSVRTGQRVVISAGHGLREREATINYLAPVVSEETRTSTARVVLANPDGIWRPGMFITGRVEVFAEELPVVVPTTALQTVDGDDVIFVEQDDGIVPRRVEVGRLGATHVEIAGGLEAGERYVASGGFTLKAELEREQFGQGHSH